MKIKKITKRKANNNEKVALTIVGDGYLQGSSGSLPDVDNDFQSDKRDNIKQYYEKRYNLNGRERVFSAGTTTTLKAKAILKDTARIYGIPHKTINVLTKGIADAEMTWSQLVKEAFNEKINKGARKRILNFINEYPQVIKDIRYIIGQPKAYSIHASALIITPDHKDGKTADCFDFLPIRRLSDGSLVSEIDGYSIDDIGLLKNDVLATKELTKTHNFIKLTNEIYGTDYSVKKFAESNLDDPKVYELIANGYTQEVFQFSGGGMTKFMVDMQPTKFEDLIAGTSLYRPASLDSGSAETYNDCKKGIVEPVYLWGTHHILKETYGVLAYQEQLAQMSRDIGGFSIEEGVKLVKLISKKKTDKIHEMKDKFMVGADQKGCPKEDAIKIWDMIESGGSYLFNKSHATSYSVISYIGAYFKANYPTIFYNVSLELAGKDDIPNILAEMSIASDVKIVAPDINISDDKFLFDEEKKEIYWSLTKIDKCGLISTQGIIRNRNLFGEFKSLKHFIVRMCIKAQIDNKIKLWRAHKDEFTVLGKTFPDGMSARKYVSLLDYTDKFYAVYGEDIKLTKEQLSYLRELDEKGYRAPITSEVLRNLILAGCFDKVEGCKSVADRWGLIQQASELFGFDIDRDVFKKDLVFEHYFWSTMQIEVSGIGSVDYKRVYDASQAKKYIKNKGKYMTLDEVSDIENDSARGVFCCGVSSFHTFEYTDKKTGELKVCGKVTLSQNKHICSLTIWSDKLEEYKDIFFSQEPNKIIIFNAVVRYSDYLKTNEILSQFNTQFYLV